MNNNGLKVGLEIHQQLDTGRKLFCSCSCTESKLYTREFVRNLRVAKSEIGQHDQAAIFESSKSLKINYHVNPDTSCLVEEDEEPPHELDQESLMLALTISVALESKIFTRIYPMRKMVIDGSNTSGFQRTMLISQGGKLEYGKGKSIGVQSICLEEDAAKNLGQQQDVRHFGLDRLGVPLLEIALEPSSPKELQEIREIALAVGRLLRATGKVARGIGTIRQDVNVSMDGGSVVEVKGVQQLDQLEKVVEFEEKRQKGLQIIAKKIIESNIKISQDTKNISNIMQDCKSKIIQDALKQDFVIRAIKLENGAGIFGFSPDPRVRLGLEIAQVVRFFKVGGVFHSDELPKYGIEQKDLDKIKTSLNVQNNDGFLLVAVPVVKDDVVVKAIIKRFQQARNGVPAETRLATPTGQTVFLRPRPGAARMYPETDVKPIPVYDLIESAKQNIPKSWDQIMTELQNKYNLNLQLAEQILDSQYYKIFEEICKNKNCLPNFVASTLCSTITNLERKGLDSKLLTLDHIKDCFDKLGTQEITKESIDLIFEKIMNNGAKTTNEAMQQLNLLDKIDIDELLEKLVSSNLDMIKKQGQRAQSPLMGMIMKQVRGKIPGNIINQKLKELIKKNI